MPDGYAFVINVFDAAQAAIKAEKAEEKAVKAKTNAMLQETAINARRIANEKKEELLANHPGQQTDVNFKQACEEIKNLTGYYGRMTVTMQTHVAKDRKAEPKKAEENTLRSKL